MRLNNKGFSAVEGLLIVLVLVVMVTAGVFVVSRSNNDSTQKNNKQSNAADMQADETKDTNIENSSEEPAISEEISSNNSNILEMKEWNLKFTIPDELTDVEYYIDQDTAYFYARLKGSKLRYRSDYKEEWNGYKYSYAKAILMRRTTDGFPGAAYPDTKGLKIGDYYYFTAWSFSGLATGNACNMLYVDDSGVESGVGCGEEADVSVLLNDIFDDTKTSLLESIEPL